MVSRFVWPAMAVLILIGCTKPESPPADGPAASAASDSASAPAAVAPSSEPGPTVAPEQPATDLYDQIQALARAGELEQGIALAEQVLAADPKNIKALGWLARLAQDRGVETAARDRKAANGFFFKSASAMRRLRDAKPVLDDREKQLLPSALYTEACAFAVEDQPDKAMASLKEAMAAGFYDIARLTSDADLAKIRENPEFQAMLETARAEIQKRFREEARQEIAQNQPFSFSFSLPDMQGKPVSLADYRDKVVIVDIWGTWCPPCRMGIPHFVALHSKYRDLGLEIVGVNYEHSEGEDAKAAITRFAQENGISYPCVIGDDATQAQVPDFQGFPTTLFIDREGVVRLKIVGYRAYEKLEAIVLELLEAKPSTT